MAIVTPVFFRMIGDYVGGLTMRFNATNKVLAATYLSPFDLAANVQSQGATVVTGLIAWIGPDMKMRIAAPASFSINSGTGQNGTPIAGFLQPMPLAAANNPGEYGVGTPWGVTATHAVFGTWDPELPPVSDTKERTARETSTAGRSLNGTVLRVDEPSLTERIWKFGYMPMKKMWTENALAANDRSLQDFIENGWRFRYWPNKLVPGTFYDYYLSQDTIQTFAPERQFNPVALYEHDIRGWKLP